MANEPHSIEIVIDPSGKISGEVKGVAGPRCGPLSEWLDQLGLLVSDRQTPDYRKQPKQAVTRPAGR